MPLTAEQLTRLRQRPHRTRLYLGIYEPTTALAARLNMPGVVQPERVLTISILAGDFNEVTRGMTVYIGTFPNGRDVGRLRAISCSATELTVAENAIDWQDGWYLTVVRYFEPWSVFPRIVLDANNVPLFYKDYDIGYADQNQTMDPVVLMGPPSAGFLQTGAFGVYYSSSGTFDPTPGGQATGFAWVFEGGIPSASLERDPGWVQYTGAGHFTTSLTVDTDQGKSLTGRRHVMVYTRPDEGPNRPIVRWGFRSFEGARASGGYAISIFVREQADQVKVTDGALVVIFSEDWEGGVKGKAAAGREHRQDVLFVGYIENDSISIDFETNIVEFRAASVTRMMSLASTYSATLESKLNAVTWNEMRDMTLDRAVIHFLRWHSTILEIADFHPTGDTKPVQFIDFERGNLENAMQSLLESALLGNMVADRQGALWAEIDLNVVPTGSARLVTDTALGLTRQDWRGQMDIRRSPATAIAYLELGGIAYGGPQTGSMTPLLAAAPGEAAEYQGGVARYQGLILASQEQLNQLAGNALAAANALYPEVTVPMAGDYRQLDIAPQQRLNITLAPTENFRGINWQSKPFITQEIVYDHQPSDQSLLMEARLKEETDGPPGVTVIIPVEPPYDWGGLPDWDIDFPPFIPFPPVLPPIEPPPNPGNTVYAVPADDGGVDANKKVMRTRNFWASGSSTTWEAFGISGSAWTPFESILDLWLDPRDPMNRAYMLSHYSSGSSAINGPRVYKTETLNQTIPVWTQILDATTVQNIINGLGAGKRAYALAMDWRVPDRIAALCRSGTLGTIPFVVLITDDGGFNWRGGTGSFGGADDNDDHSSDLVIGGSQMYATIDGKMSRSDDIGHTFFRVGTGTANDPSGPLQMVLGLDGGQVIGWVENIGANKRMYFSKQGNTSLSGADRVQWPYILGAVELGPMRNSTTLARAFRFHPSGRVYAAVTPREAEPGDTESYLLSAGNIGGTWQIVHTFEQVALGYLQGLELHMGDANRLAVFQRAVGLLGSDDAGVSWINRTGNMHTALGVTLNALLSSVLIRVIRFAWTSL